jgi:penicillin-binding protein activator
MRTVKWMAVGVLAAVWLAGCSGSVRRISPDDVVDLSGRWNDTDSQLVAEQMVKEALTKPWLANFMKANGKNPTVIVGTIKNKTDEHIAIDTFQKDIERELTNSGSVQFVASKDERDEVRYEREDQQTQASEDTRKQMYQETGSDFMLQGTISKITDATAGKATFYYQVDMEMVDMQKSVKVWFGNKKIKKYITGAGARP